MRYRTASRSRSPSITPKAVKIAEQDESMNARESLDDSTTIVGQNESPSFSSTRVKGGGEAESLDVSSTPPQAMVYTHQTSFAGPAQIMHEHMSSRSPSREFRTQFESSLKMEEKELTEENIRKLYVALLKEREALQQVVPSAQSAIAAMEAKKEQAESQLADERAKREALELENQQLRAFRDMYSPVVKDLHSEQNQHQEEVSGWRHRSSNALCLTLARTWPQWRLAYGTMHVTLFSKLHALRCYTTLHNPHSRCRNGIDIRAPCFETL